MDVCEKYCGKRTYRLYTLLVAVPGANPYYRKTFITFCVLVLSLATIFQLLKFVTAGFTLKLLVELMPTITATIGCLMYLFYLTQTPNLQFQYNSIMSIMRYLLNQERTPEEDAIKEHYVANTKIFMRVYTMVLTLMVCGMSVSGLIPSVLNVIIPLNHTRENVFMYDGEIFIDQEKYFYYIYFFECVSCAVTGTLLVVSVNMGVIIMQCSCGMSAVLGHQLENLTEIQIDKISEKIDYGQFLTRKLQMYIRNHQIILECGYIIAEFYDIPLTLLLAGSFCTLTMSLVQVTDPDLISVKIIVYTIGQTVQLFLVSVMGQTLMDAGLQTSEDAYSARWEICPANVRKMLQLMIMRSTIPCMITARGLYIFSMENFISVIQTVTSFYMVLRQSR